MADIKVPTGPALVTIPNVELAQAGTWRLSSGEAVITREDLAAAVGAIDCPAVRSPVLKLGHTDSRFDGEPAVGWVGAMALAEDGETVVGDYRGVPAWLGAVMASAYPDRSIEATRNFRCQIGHTHPMVITAVALLGVTAPGIGTLASLQDIADLYQVAASAHGDGEQLTSTIKGGRMPAPEPEPGPTTVTAAATSETVRRAYYEQAGYDRWICEMQLDPDLQLIVMDDASGGYFRVPVVVDGDEVTFAEAVPVAVEYIDKPKKVAASSLVFASRAESVLIAEAATPPAVEPTTADQSASALTAEQHLAIDELIDSHRWQDIDRTALTAEQWQALLDRAGRGIPEPAATTTTQTPVAAAASGLTEETEVTGMDFSDEQLAALRVKLGLPEDATIDPAALVDGIDKLAASDGSPTKTRHMPGTITVDREVWDGMHKRIQKLEEIRAQQAETERDRTLAAAVTDGKFAPSRVEHWRRLWEADPQGTRDVLATLTAGTVPTADYGVPGGEDAALQSEFEHIFAPRGN